MHIVYDQICEKGLMHTNFSEKSSFDHEMLNTVLVCVHISRMLGSSSTYIRSYIISFSLAIKLKVANSVGMLSNSLLHSTYYAYYVDRLLGLT